MNKEREEILTLIFEKVAPDLDKGNWPAWKLFFWALFHPFKFGQAHGRAVFALELINGIQNGEHLDED